jgi:hypothetical protein
MIKFSSVLVTCTLKNPKTGQEVQKEEFLSVYAWEAGLDAAQVQFDQQTEIDEKVAQDEFDEKEQTEESLKQKATPPSSPAKKHKASEKETILISPVQHKFNYLQTAIIGKPGLAKLKLIVDPNRDKLYMIFENDAVY